MIVIQIFLVLILETILDKNALVIFSTLLLIFYIRKSIQILNKLITYE